MTKAEQDTAIVAGLRNPDTTYADLMSRHRVGMTRVITLAKLHGLTRPRGRKPKTQPVSTPVSGE